MREHWLGILGALLPTLLAAQSGQSDRQGQAGAAAGDAVATASGPWARIAMLRPHDGATVGFEAGYIRHLEWHRQAHDPWRWYGWTVWVGERQRWFVYATFGHAAASFDHAVSPADDERDNVSNVTPHAEFVGSGLYEYLAALSRGSSTGEPSSSPRVELTTVDVASGSARAFEAALAVEQPKLQGETLWFRMAAGGPALRYLRLRPRPNVASILEDRSQQALFEKAAGMATKMTVEILNLRPAMSYGLPTGPP